MAYNLDFVKKGELKLHIRKFLLFPTYWTDGTKQIIGKVTWKQYKFTNSNKSKIPTVKGIYCFVVKPNYNGLFPTNYLFYVGQTKRTLKKRYQEYLDDQAGKGKPRDKIFEMLNLYKDDIYFFCTDINLNSRIDEVEDKLLNVFVPHINTSIPEAKITRELRYIYE